MTKIRKAVIPAAGYGTRFLPATKAMPKEMLPIVDKPIIQYVVEEAVASGIEEIIIITGWHKRAIEDHFDYPFELEHRLKQSGKLKELKEIRRIADLAKFIYVRQREPLGNGDAVLCAREIIGDEPFVVMWGDEFIWSDPPRLQQMMTVWEKYQNPVISAVRIKNKHDLGRYGIADVKPVEENVHQILSIVEKPKPNKAPSNLATHGAYILPPEIFEILANLSPTRDKEIWLSDAIDQLIKTRVVYACEITNGKYYDTGNKLEYLKAVVDFALRHDEYNGHFKAYLKSLEL